MLSFGFFQRGHRSSSGNGDRRFLRGRGQRVAQFGERNAEFLAGRKNHGALEQIFEFANVARPGVGDERVHGFGWNVLHGFIQTTAELLHEVADKKRDVLAAIAKRRNLNRENIQAIEKITAEFAFGDQAAQVRVGGGDHAGIHVNGAGSAEAFEFMLLQNTQQFGLQFQRNVANFIEKNGAFIGEFEAANFLGNGSGEGAAFVAEKFAFQQAAGNGGAIDFDEGAFTART